MGTYFGYAAMNSVTSFSTLSLQGIMAWRITSKVALQRIWKERRINDHKKLKKMSV